MDKEWEKYIEYLKEWANNHEDSLYAGMSPVCFDEFKDNEMVEEENE